MARNGNQAKVVGLGVDLGISPRTNVSPFFYMYLRTCVPAYLCTAYLCTAYLCTCVPVEVAFGCT